LMRLWRRAGMRYKVKAVVGLYQCVSAVPNVFDVRPPRDLPPEYTRLTSIVEFPSDLGIEVVMPSACGGSYLRRLIISSLWPLVLLLLVVAGRVIWEVSRDRRKVQNALSTRLGDLEAALVGLRHALPLILSVTFLLVPSTSKRIFKTWAEHDSKPEVFLLLLLPSYPVCWLTV
jgi:hypothetical protein